MLLDWLAVETLAYIEKTFSAQHSLPHDRLLFYGGNRQFVVSPVRVTAATDQVARTGHSYMTINGPPGDRAHSRNPKAFVPLQPVDISREPGRRYYRRILHAVLTVYVRLADQRLAVW